MEKKYVFCFLFGVTLRVYLLFLDFPNVFSLTYQKELATPITSYPRIQEGLTMLKLGNSPYAGDLYHQGPLVLFFYGCLEKLTEAVPFGYSVKEKSFFGMIYLIYIIGDILIAFLLKRICELTNQQNIGSLTMTLYFLNPFVILSLTSLSTILWNNLAIVASIYFALRQKSISCFFIALASYLSFYPIILIPPLILISKKNSFKYTIETFFWIGCLIYISFLQFESWGFLDETYGSILMVRDLTPNIGLFWYFFTEVFEHFRNFYLFAYQYHIFLYVIPMRIALGNRPLFLLWITLAIIAIFKSYPSAGDIVLQVAFIPLIFPLLKKTSYTYLTGIIFIFSAVLAPLFWLLWIYHGSGNANFYYAISLVVNVAQILFVTDALDSVTTLDYWAKKESKYKIKTE